MTLPNDPVMLLSVINTQLRDHYATLELLCDDQQIDMKVLCDRLGAIDYSYDEANNQFV